MSEIVSERERERQTDENEFVRWEGMEYDTHWVIYRMRSLSPFFDLICLNCLFGSIVIAVAVPLGHVE